MSHHTLDSIVSNLEKMAIVTFTIGITAIAIIMAILPITAIEMMAVKIIKTKIRYWKKFTKASLILNAKLKVLLVANSPFQLHFSMILYSCRVYHYFY